MLWRCSAGPGRSPQSAVWLCRGSAAKPGWCPQAWTSAWSRLLAWDLIDQYLSMPWPVLRWTAWAFISGTVYLNIAAGHGNLTASIMHAAMPVLFITIVEGIRRLSYGRRARPGERDADRADPGGTLGSRAARELPARPPGWCCGT